MNIAIAILVAMVAQAHGKVISDTWVGAVCVEDGDGGSSYRGDVAVTKSGRDCQRWDSKSLNGISYPDKYPNDGLNDNYCRNPDGEPGPWCFYAEGSSLSWGICDVPICGGAVCIENGDGGSSYRGDVAVTKSGRNCQRWDSKSLNGISYPDKYPNDGLSVNYCRNPDGEPGPWCFYAEGSSLSWGICDVPVCGGAVCIENGDGGSSYRGDVAVTKSGRDCQRWDSKSLNGISYPDKYPNDGLSVNYCRNPDGEPGPWCFYAEGSSLSWGRCDVPICNEAASPAPSSEQPPERLWSYWSDWSDWSQCSADCAGGTRTRTRTCLETEYECYGESQETEVCNPKCRNVAYLGTATQDSTASDGVASRAIDGDSNGAYWRGSVTQTQSKGANAWWKIEFPMDIYMNIIIVYGRTDCCQERLKNAKVYIDEDLVFWLSKTTTNFWKEEVNKVGRSIKIQNRPGNGELSIAEVEVFGARAS